MLKIAIIYGGKSTEHDISVLSSKYVIENIDKEKYEITEIFINRDGIWYDNTNKSSINSIVEFIKRFDLVFPVLHGLYGEDGTLQGMLDLMDIPYVGCGVLASAVCMDKVYTKILFDRCNIKNAKSIYIKYISQNKYIYYDKQFNEKWIDFNQLNEIIFDSLKYPLFVKPSNSGSSIGVCKVNNYNDLQETIEFTSKYDSKILIEEGINGKEVEVAVLGNSIVGIEVSNVGEICSAEDFYSYSSKYNNKETYTKIHATISKEQSEKIRKLAKQAYIAVDGDGLSRVDFFVEHDTGKIYINEINTLPGLTNISMYPMLMEDFGYDKTELLDRLIELGLTRSKRNNKEI